MISRFLIKLKRFANRIPFRRCCLLAIVFIFTTLAILTLIIVILDPMPLMMPELVPVPTRLLPLDYWHHRLNHPEDYEQSGRNACTTFPSPLNIAIVSMFWQKVRLPAGNLSVYVAFWDERPADPVLRVMAYAGTALPALYCQVWYVNNGEPTTVRATLPPALARPPASRVLSCSLPFDSYPMRPEAVTVVAAPCDTASNALNILATADYGNNGNGDPLRAFRDTLVVCLVLPQASDVSLRLVEWLEMVREFGADEVYVFYSRLHPTVSAILDGYQKGRPGGLIVPFLLPLAPPPRRPAESPLGGAPPACLYHGLAWHDWVLQLELAEMLVPGRDGSWRHLIEREQREAPFDVLQLSRYTFTNVSAARPDTSTYMLQHTTRADDPDGTDFTVPTFLSSATVVSFSRHHTECIEPPCRIRRAGEGTARLHRYLNTSDVDVSWIRGSRGSSGDGQDTVQGPESGATVEDLSLWKWRENVTSAVARAHLKHHVSYLRRHGSL